MKHFEVNMKCLGFCWGLVLLWAFGCLGFSFCLFGIHSPWFYEIVFLNERDPKLSGLEDHKIHHLPLESTSSTIYIRSRDYSLILLSLPSLKL